MTPHLTPKELFAWNEAGRALLTFPIFAPADRWPSAPHADGAPVAVKPSRSERDVGVSA